MNEFTIRQAAALLGISDDTVRRWGETGRITVTRGENGRQTVAGADLVALLAETSPPVALADEFPLAGSSSRNRFVGLVTAITKDTVMAQVDVQAGPFRAVSLLSREAVDDLGLEVGMLVVATAKATNVGIELPVERA